MAPDIVDYILAFIIAMFLWTGATAAINSARVRRRLPVLVARQLARRTLAVPGDLPLSEAVRRAQDAEAGGIVTVTSLFIGMVMSTQFAFGLQKFGGMEYTGRVVALTFARELAPTLTAVIVGGRIGAGMTAELGAMAVTEQLDAISALGADPVKKLVLPRLIASIFVLPIVGTFALILGFTGAMVITDSQFGIPAAFFFQSALDQLVLMDYLMGLVKTPAFGVIIALLGCHFGMRTRGGTAGVGSSTTKTVVAISIAILIADFFLTKLVFVFWNVL